MKMELIDVVKKYISINKELLKNNSNDNKKMEEKISNKRLFIILGFLGLSIFFILFGIYYVRIVRLAIEATKDYNEAVVEYNVLSQNYDKAISKVSIDNIDGMELSIGRLETEKEDFWSVIKTLNSGNTVDKIKKDTMTICQFKDYIKSELKIVNQIYNPSSDWVVERLKNVNQVIETGVVTVDDDPNQMLGKIGGYSSCIYFTVNTIDSESVDGDTIIAKGTDAGGAIEVYENIKDAEERCDYLASFDNTIFYSGSYAIIGTMVIRTSYQLEAEAQLNLTNEITKAFTM